jgi:hypothetical protein
MPVFLSIPHALAAHLNAALTSNSRRVDTIRQPATFGTTPYFPNGRRVLVPGTPLLTVPTYLPPFADPVEILNISTFKNKTVCSILAQNFLLIVLLISKPDQNCMQQL